MSSLYGYCVISSLSATANTKLIQRTIKKEWHTIISVPLSRYDTVTVKVPESTAMLSPRLFEAATEIVNVPEAAGVPDKVT